jgi:hypothetical protein
MVIYDHSRANEDVLQRRFLLQLKFWRCCYVPSFVNFINDQYIISTTFLVTLPLSREYHTELFYKPV